MQNIKTRILVNTIFFFLVYAVMFYVSARAIKMPITHDEAYSFYNVKHFWWVEALCTGNTHWFNFLAIKACVIFGFEKGSQLRWFTLLSSGIFLTVVYFWIKSIRDVSLKFFAFSITVLNPFVIDYLSLARGYSTALMFEVLAIICYYLAIKNRMKNTAMLALFFSGMAAIANFNFFYFFTAFCVIYFYHFYFKQGFNFLRNRNFYLECIFVLGIISLVVKALQFITVCSNDIGAYGAEDLVGGIFVGVIETFIYTDFNVSEGTLYIIAFVFCLFVFMAALFGLRTSIKQPIHWYRSASAIFLIMMALCVFNKWCFGVLYPTYRTALMFYPLIAMVLVGFFNAILIGKKNRQWILLPITLFITVHFLMNLSLRKSFDYWQQSDTKTCFILLDSLGAKKVGIAPELFGVYRNYYQLTECYGFEFEGESVNTMLPNGMDDSQALRSFDYLVLLPPYNLSFYKNNHVILKGEKYYEGTGTLMVKVLPGK
ncbi:MAG: hypothetical protein V4565_07400 [Bacteroidota bacterium]